MKRNDEVGRGRIEKRQGEGRGRVTRGVEGEERGRARVKWRKGEAGVTWRGNYMEKTRGRQM